MSEATRNAAMWRQHLEAAIAKPDQTIILASLDDKRGMVMQAATTRPQDLVDAARSLIDQAKERLEDEVFAEDGDDEAVEARDDLVTLLDDVLAMLPDPNADEA